MKVIESEAIEWADYPTGRAGVFRLKVLATGEAMPDCGFMLALSSYGTGDDAYETPRHHHNFEQIRFTVEGTHNYGPKKNLPEGWVAYFPAGAHYGPQHDEGGVVFALQFGESYLTPDLRQRAHDLLVEKGTFAAGVYTRDDPGPGEKKNQDAVEAMWEAIHGRPVEYPEPRYPEPIPMNPAAFAWMPLHDGLSHKPLGSFTERGVEVSAVRWETDSTYTLGPERTQFLFSTFGDLDVAGERRGPRTVVWSQHGESVDATAPPGTEALVFALPRIADSDSH
jgi:hypothetical protein